MLGKTFRRSFQGWSSRPTSTTVLATHHGLLVSSATQLLLPVSDYSSDRCTPWPRPALSLGIIYVYRNQRSHCQRSLCN